MVGLAGTCQPAAAARRSQAGRRARPAYDAGKQVRQQPLGRALFSILVKSWGFPPCDLFRFCSNDNFRGVVDY